MTGDTGFVFHAFGYAVVPWLDGVSWLRPFAFCVIAILCRLFVDQRVRLTHEMWLTSEAQCRARTSGKSPAQGLGIARSTMEGHDGRLEPSSSSTWRSDRPTPLAS